MTNRTVSTDSIIHIDHLTYARGDNRGELVIRGQGGEVLQTLSVTYMEGNKITAVEITSLESVAHYIHKLFLTTIGDANMQSNQDWGTFLGTLNPEKQQVIEGHYTGAHEEVVYGNDHSAKMIQGHLDHLWKELSPLSTQEDPILGEIAHQDKKQSNVQNNDDPSLAATPQKILNKEETGALSSLKRLMITINTLVNRVGAPFYDFMHAFHDKNKVAPMKPEQRTLRLSTSATATGATSPTESAPTSRGGDKQAGMRGTLKLSATGAKRQPSSPEPTKAASTLEERSLFVDPIMTRETPPVPHPDPELDRLMKKELPYKAWKKHFATPGSGEEFIDALANYINPSSQESDSNNNESQDQTLSPSKPTNSIENTTLNETNSSTRRSHKKKVSKNKALDPAFVPTQSTKENMSRLVTVDQDRFFAEDTKSSLDDVIVYLLAKLNQSGVQSLLSDEIILLDKFMRPLGAKTGVRTGTLKKILPSAGSILQRKVLDLSPYGIHALVQGFSEWTQLHHDSLNPNEQAIIDQIVEYYKQNYPLPSVKKNEKKTLQALSYGMKTKEARPAHALCTAVLKGTRKWDSDAWSTISGRATWQRQFAQNLLNEIFKRKIEQRIKEVFPDQ